MFPNVGNVLPPPGTDPIPKFPEDAPKEPDTSVLDPTKLALIYKSVLFTFATKPIWVHLLKYGI